MTKATVPSSFNMGGSGISGYQIVMAIIGIVLVIVAAYYTLYFYRKHFYKFQKGRHMQVLDRYSLARDKLVVVLGVGEKAYILAMSGQSSTVVDTLDRAKYEEDAAKAEPPAPAGPVQAGSAIMQRMIGAMQTNIDNRLKKNKDAPAADKPSAAPPQDEPGPEADDLDAVYRKLQARKAKNSLKDSLGGDADEKRRGGDV